MKLLTHVEGKLSFLLVFSIMVLCAGFFIVSCGNKPQQKTKNANKGACAIDFNHCPAGKSCTAAPKGSIASRVPDITNKQVTLEAWIKVGAATSTPMTIFSRHDGSNGVKLFIENNIPKFAIGRLTTTSTVPTGCTVNSTSTECTISSGISLVANAWTHIAGVLTNLNHSLDHAACSGAQAGAEAETPHMDMYVNGAFADCSTSASLYANNPANEDMGISFLNGGVIDELRFWVTGRTATQINNCKNTELGLGGECDRGDSNLAAYYRLNECEHADITDWSGNGFSGGFEYQIVPQVFHEWEDGWVTPGAPITPAD